MGDEYVSVEHLFLALLKYPSRSMKELFRQYGITRERFLAGIVHCPGQPESHHVTIRKQPMTPSTKYRSGAGRKSQKPEDGSGHRT